jgi:hypothetical protein
MYMLPLMIVPLMVWVAVWTYLWALGLKVKKLEMELARRESDAGDSDSDAWPPAPGG